MEITTQDIVRKLNEQGYNYFGDRPRAGADRIYFGRGYVLFDNGRLSNKRSGHARALTIGHPALEACELALAQLS
jgi:hypothetical protein